MSIASLAVDLDIYRHQGVKFLGNSSNNDVRGIMLGVGPPY